MLCSAESDSLNFEFPADEREKIDSGDDHVAAEHTGRLVVNCKVRAEFFKNFGGQEGDLALVILPIVVKPIPANSMTRDATDPRNLDERVVLRCPAVVPKIVMAGRNEDLPDQHRAENEKLADAETDFADNFSTEALFQFPQDFGLGDLLELIVQGWLQHANG